MRKSLQLLGCLAVLAVPMFTLPAFAQSAEGMAPNGKEGHHGEWRAQHEEMGDMRREREQLESERDSLKVRCLDAKGQDRSACQSKMEDLHKREEEMHARMGNMHDKMEAEHQNHDGMRKEHHGAWKAKHEMKGKPAVPPNAASKAPGSKHPTAKKPDAEAPANND